MNRKPLFWMGSSKEDLSRFPDAVKQDMGHALHLAQAGSKAGSAKPMQGFGRSGVLEIIDDHDGDTYRAVYTVRFQNVVYVLHSFQKKSKQGIKTPQQEIELVKRRLKAAEAHYQAMQREGASNE